MADDAPVLVLTDDERERAVAAVRRRTGLDPVFAREAVAAVQLAVHDEDPRIVAVDALHYPYASATVGNESRPYCDADGEAWPCPTLRALHPDRQTWETPS